MRNVTRSYLAETSPSILCEPGTIAAANAVALAGNANTVSRRLYSDPYLAGPDEGNQSRVVDALNFWYFGKCAYCERFYKLDVEHFRPKGEIRDEHNNLVSTEGYYWLCYEWSNLLPACISCNRDGGKNSKFPFLDGSVRVTAPRFNALGELDAIYCRVNHQYLLDELPSLLNPETDTEIDRFFGFEIDANREGVRIVGRDESRRGEITINICKLNRQEIRRDRLQDVIMDFVNSVHNSIALLKATENQPAFQGAIQSHITKIHADGLEDKLTHTLLRRYIVRSLGNFEQLVVPFIIPEFRTIISAAYTRYSPI